MVRAPRFPNQASFRRASTPPPARVKTRGVPDMREPIPGHPPSMQLKHMPEPNYSKFENTSFTQGYKQPTVIDKASTQGTIFDELQRKFDPERKNAEGIPTEYHKPGDIKTKSLSQRRPLSRGTFVNQEQKTQLEAQLQHTYQSGRIKAKEYQLKIEQLKAKHRAKPQTKPQEPPKQLSPQAQRAKSLLELREKEQGPLADERPTPLTEVPSISQSKVDKQLKQEPSEIKTIPSSYRYPYSKQVIKDIKGFESHKSKFKRK